MTSYLEFAVASNFSFLRGASHAEELMLQAAHIGLDGIGLCDRNSVAGVVRAHLIKREQKLTLRYHPGARLVFADGTPDILAYPRDRPAWGRLCRLLTAGNLRAEKGDCILLLDDLLDIARITRGKLELKTERVKLTDVVDSAVEAARPLLDGKHHSFVVSLPPEVLTLNADPLRLSQVLSNLLTNAAKYTDPGGHIRLSGYV